MRSSGGYKVEGKGERELIRSSRKGGGRRRGAVSTTAGRGEGEVNPFFQRVPKGGEIHTSEGKSTWSQMREFSFLLNLVGEGGRSKGNIDHMSAFLIHIGLPSFLRSGTGG